MSNATEQHILTDKFENEDTLKGKYLTFSVAAETYGVEIKYVSEIAGVPEVTWIPDLPKFIKGVINLRGKVISVMDMRDRFSLPEKDYDVYTSVIVMDIPGQSLGLIVDRVRDVVDIPQDRIEPPPSLVQASTGRFIQGLGKIGDEVSILLDAKEISCF